MLMMHLEIRKAATTLLSPQRHQRWCWCCFCWASDAASSSSADAQSMVHREHMWYDSRAAHSKPGRRAKLPNAA